MPAGKGYGAKRHRGLEFHLAAVVVEASKSLAGPTPFPQTVPGCEIQLLAVRQR